MAKVTNPLLSGSASGQFGRQMVFDKRGFVRQYVTPANPQSVDQMTVRNRLGDIQRELKILGTDLRPQVASLLGYRWNSLIISEALNNNGAKWVSLAAVYAAFTAPQKSDWESADDAVGNVNTDGLVFYIVAKCFYDVCLRIGGDGLITAPTADNSSTISSEWQAAA
jgi:hypothetical protein